MLTSKWNKPFPVTLLPSAITFYLTYVLHPPFPFPQFLTPYLDESFDWRPNCGLSGSGADWTTETGADTILSDDREKQQERHRQILAGIRALDKGDHAAVAAIAGRPA